MRMLRATCLGILIGCSGCVWAQDAEWIWVTPQARSGQRAHMLRLFEVSGEVVRARLVATCDNRMVVYLNGAEVARGDVWMTPVAAEVSAALAPGRNVIAVEGINDESVAALALRLDIEYTDGTSQRVVSSGQWRVSEDAPEGWQEPGFALFRDWHRASVLGSTSDTSLTWGGVMMHREATPASAVRVPEGFRVELVYSSQAGEGSWITMDLDERDRAVVAVESGGLARITRTGPGGAVYERLDADVGMCQGLLFAHDSLYCTVTENADRDGGLHRLRDTDGDDVFDEHEVLTRFPSKSEHGAHGMALGPDGMIYSVHGNYAPLPEHLDTENSPYRDWAEDVLEPRLWDPRGHAVGIMSPGARVLRCDPEGERWEIVAAGMRNPYDIAFAPNGELFTYDADMEWDIGLPWYRPPRIVHVVEGGEYGWRSGSAKWPDWYPDSLPPVCDTDLSSPVGVAFATDGMFPEPWASCLFAGDWAYGRILAVHLTPNGASWDGRYEAFVLGVPLNVTGLTFGSDGAMWFVTGGRGTQSGLYRVTYEGEEPPGHGEVMRSLTPEMELRRALEATKPTEMFPIAGLDKAFGVGDRFLRFAARLVCERFGYDTALADFDVLGRYPAELLLTAARVGKDVSSVPASVAAAARSSADVQVLLARSTQLAMARNGVEGTPTPGSIGGFPYRNARLNRELAEVFASAGTPGIGAALVGLVETASTREERIHSALWLRLVVDQLDQDQLDRYFTWLHETRSLAGGMSFEGYIRAIEREALERLSEGERERVSALVARLDAEAAEGARSAPARPFVKQWDLAGALAAVEGSGGERSIERGKLAFTAARCVECHRFGGAGGSTGPDLTGVALRFSRRDMLEAMVEPSKAISDQYEASVVTLKDGRVLTGRLLQLNGGTMAVLTDPYSLVWETFNPGDLVSAEPSPVSPMPPSLLDTLSAREVADLVAYLESGAER